MVDESTETHARSDVELDGSVHEYTTDDGES